MTTWLPRRPTGMPVALVLAIGLLLLAGCSQRPAVDPIGDPRRDQIRQAILDSAWSEVTQKFPDAIRPEVPTMRAVPDRERPGAVVACLLASGIPLSPSDNGFRYNSNLGRSERVFEVVRYACSARYPAESELASYLSGSSLAALFDYQRKFVRPCLLSAGVRSPAPPDAGPDFSPSPALLRWSPYRSVWTSRLAPSTVAYLERRCPPFPGWLDLSPGGRP